MKRARIGAVIALVATVSIAILTDESSFNEISRFITAEITEYVVQPILKQTATIGIR